MAASRGGGRGFHNDMITPAFTFGIRLFICLSPWSNRTPIAPEYTFVIESPLNLFVNPRPDGDYTAIHNLIVNIKGEICHREGRANGGSMWMVGGGGSSGCLSVSLLAARPLSPPTRALSPTRVASNPQTQRAKSRPK